MLGMGSVLALTSHFQQTSPVLRGAWILDNILGIPAPPPPPDVPPLEPGGKKIKTMTERQKLEKHRSDPACSACHNLIDPLGFGLENFDFMGRWRTEDNGHPVDARGQLPTGESFRGPIELRNILLTRKDDFIRRVTGKAMGYALGRSLEDADHCTIQHLGEKLEKDGYRARTLIKEIVMSAPFRYRSPRINKELAPPAITRRPQRKEP